MWLIKWVKGRWELVITSLANKLRPYCKTDIDEDVHSFTNPPEFIEPEPKEVEKPKWVSSIATPEQKKKFKKKNKATKARTKASKRKK